MEITEADAARLERRGRRRDAFCYVGVDGILRLRNEGAYCALYDVDKGRCSEYQSRPLGCAIYPVNIDEDGRICLDGTCPQHSTVSAQEADLKGRRLKGLIATIDAEAAKRLRD